jgi:hypothetical protein
MPEEKPTQVQKRAIDVTPYVHAIWCSIEGGEPFANVIEHRSWSEDGEQVIFMLGTHNFLFAKPDELIDVIEKGPMYQSPEFHAECMAEDAARMAKRPAKPVPCPTCGHVTKAPDRGPFVD